MTKVPYSYIRSLELEGRHPHDAGCWGVTGARLSMGEGLPLGLHIDVADGAPLPPTTRPTPRELIQSSFYRRIRNAHDCVSYLRHTPALPIELRLFKGWENPSGGRIRLPQPGEEELPISHSVLLLDVHKQARLIEFENWWGGDWGD